MFDLRVWKYATTGVGMFARSIKNCLDFSGSRVTIQLASF